MRKVNEMNEIIIGALSGIAGAFLTIYQFNRKSWGQNVSTNRMEWINSFRTEVSTLLAVVDLGNLEDISSQHCSEGLIEAFRCKNKLITRLNIHKGVLATENLILSALIMKFNHQYLPQLANDNQWYLDVVHYTKIILEEEWQRVKKEARGRGLK
jgi:hypothetical protein